MQHPQTTTPFRFRTPPGWPTPSAEWVELHQGARPALGWSPAPDVAPAPANWDFWRPQARGLRASMPSSARRLRLTAGIALGVAVASIVLAVVLAAVDGPAVLGLPSLVASLAVLVVSAVRLGDVADETAAAVRDRAAAWRRTELPARARAARPDLDEPTAIAAWEAAAWGLPVARPFVEAATLRTGPARRRGRAAAVIVSGAAAVVLVVGATLSAAPALDVVQSLGDGQTLAYGLQDGAPNGDGPSDGGQSGDGSSDDAASNDPWVSDDGTISATFADVDADAYAVSCGAVETSDDSGCWAWTIEGECDGPAEVTIGFSDSASGDEVRSDARTVVLKAGTPLVFTATGEEGYAGIDDVVCYADADPAAEVHTAALDSDSADDEGSWPDGCVDYGCAGWELTPVEDCRSATVQFSVDEEIDDLDRYDVVVETPLHRGEAVDVWAGGGWSSDHDTALVGVTCR